MNASASSRGRPTRGRKSPAGRNPVSRTAELAQKRERRSFRLRLLAFVGLLLVLVLAAGYQFWLRDSSLVAVKKLQIVGVSTKTEEGKQIDQAVRTAMGEMTTLHVQPELLDQELSRFPRVASSAIKTGFPDSATVTVSLREDGSIFGEGSNALLIATDGTVLGPADGQESSFPLIGDGDPPPEGSAGGMLTGAALNQALILGAVPPEIRSFVAGTRTTREGVEVEFDNGLVMLFGDASHADQKWRAASALIADQSFDTSSYVDLTVPRRPGVSAEAPAADGQEEGSAEPSGESVTG